MAEKVSPDWVQKQKNNWGNGEKSRQQLLPLYTFLKTCAGKEGFSPGRHLYRKDYSGWDRTEQLEKGGYGYSGGGMPFLPWEEYVFSRNIQNNLDGRPVTFSKAFRETALGILQSIL